MTYEIVMPQLGLTMEEGAVVSWLKSPGERVEKGEVLFTVETDKAEMEVESANSGYLRAIRAEIGKKVPVGTIIAVLSDESDEAIPDNRYSEAARISSALAQHPTTSKSEVLRSGSASVRASDSHLAAGSEFPASPRARRLAEELGIEIAAVKPARGQRIVEEDVRRFQQEEKGRPSRVAPEASVTPTRKSANRKIVAQRMTESFQTAPHFYLGVEANATNLTKFRERLLAGWSGEAGKLTYTDLFLRALSMALKEHSQVNAFWQNDSIKTRDSVDVGFAVQMPDGLIAPVIRNADHLSLLDLSRQRYALTEKARIGKLGLQDLEGGSATLSNLGNFGIDWFQAILNPSQSVILATGRIAKRGLVVNDSLVVCPSLVLSLSVDHRVLDGVAAAKFLGRIRELIEDPDGMNL